MRVLMHVVLLVAVFATSAAAECADYTCSQVVAVGEDRQCLTWHQVIASALTSARSLTFSPLPQVMPAPTIKMSPAAHF